MVAESAVRALVDGHRKWASRSSLAEAGKPGWRGQILKREPLSDAERNVTGADHEVEGKDRLLAVGRDVSIVALELGSALPLNRRSEQHMVCHRRAIDLHAGNRHGHLRPEDSGRHRVCKPDDAIEIGLAFVCERPSLLAAGLVERIRVGGEAGLKPTRATDRGPDQELPFLR